MHTEEGRVDVLIGYILFLNRLDSTRRASFVYDTMLLDYITDVCEVNVTAFPMLQMRFNQGLDKLEHHNNATEGGYLSFKIVSYFGLVFDIFRQCYYY